MNKGILAIGIVLLATIALVCMNLISNYQTNNELDYYILEETTEAAMIDSVDYALYREQGVLRIVREKFLESFVKRFADSVSASRDYYVKIIDFNEIPPKVSVQIDSQTVASVNGETLGILNRVDAILETKYNEDRTVGQAKNDG